MTQNLHQSKHFRFSKLGKKYRCKNSLGAFSTCIFLFFSKYSALSIYLLPHFVFAQKNPISGIDHCFKSSKGTCQFKSSILHMKNMNFLWRVTFSWGVVVVRIIKSPDSESVPLPIVAHSNPRRSPRAESLDTRLTYGKCPGEIRQFHPDPPTLLRLLNLNIVTLISWGKILNTSHRIQKLHRSVRDLPNCPRMTVPLPLPNTNKKPLLTDVRFHSLKGPRK